MNLKNNVLRRPLYTITHPIVGKLSTRYGNCRINTPWPFENQQTFFLRTHEPQLFHRRTVPAAALQSEPVHSIDRERRETRQHADPV